MTGWIGISLGDVTGVGPEVTLKAIAAEAGCDDAKYLLIGDENHLRQLNQKLGLNLPLETFSSQPASGKFFVTKKTGILPTPPEKGSPAAANASVTWLREGGERCLR